MPTSKPFVWRFSVIDAPILFAAPVINAYFFSVLFLIFIDKF